MQTLWSGHGVSPDNIVTTDVYAERALELTLQDPPQLVTRVTLSPTAWAVNLFAYTKIWYAVDTDPGPLSPPLVADSLPVLESAFRPGGIAQPGGWQQCRLPVDGAAHVLHLVSQDPYARIDIEQLVEANPTVSYW